MTDKTHDALPISDADIVSLDDVAPDIHGLRILFVNVFGVSHPDGSWTLVDAGLPFSAERIRHWAEKRFRAKPRAIVLTHGHFDHIGAVQTLAEHWDVPVFAHQLEMPYLIGKDAYPPPDPTVGGGMMAWISPLYPRDPIDLGTRVFPFGPDGQVQGMPGWRWLHTPGHTVGHASFFRDSDRVLLVGDAFCTTRQESLMAVARQTPELHGPPAYYTPDWDAARLSVERLAALQPTVLAPGHGQAMRGEDIPGKLAELARRFDELARPEHGRYVDHRRPAA
jgi:glyoxylase-like metal-dependent hydrolase (beta-lactamase superfamily II)